MTAPANTMLIPKPAPRDHAAFIPTLPYHEHANLLGNLAARERKALTQIAEAADDLATLAAACAATGDFNSAIQNAEQAIALANARQDARASKRIRRQLQHYESATAYRE